MDIEQIKNELRTLGFTEEKLNQLVELAAEEALHTAIEDLQATASDSTLEELAKTLENPPISKEDASSKLDSIFEGAYGLNAENKKEELVLNYLRQTIEDTKKTKDLYNRYQSGDPVAIATIKAQEGNPDVKEILDLM